MNECLQSVCAHFQNFEKKKVFNKTIFCTISCNLNLTVFENVQILRKYWCLAGAVPACERHKFLAKTKKDFVN